MTAAVCPSRAAPTATFVGLPPRDFANVRTSASDAPICSGYRSTPTRPMAMTSKVCSDMAADEVHAPLDVPWRVLGHLVQHDVLLQDVPAGISRPLEESQDVRDPRDPCAQPAVEPTADPFHVVNAAIAHARSEIRIDVLQVDVPD